MKSLEPPIKIPIVYIKDKQAFSSNGLRLLGKPIDLAKRLKREGYKLIHIIDVDCLNGLGTNLDIYDKVTYFINIEVECAPKSELVKKLLSYKCRVVLDSSFEGIEKIKEKNLLVGKLGKLGKNESSGSELDQFHDLLIENYKQVEEMLDYIKNAKKRIIIYQKDEEKIKRIRVWGILKELF